MQTKNVTKKRQNKKNKKKKKPRLTGKIEKRIKN